MGDLKKKLNKTPATFKTHIQNEKKPSMQFLI